MLPAFLYWLLFWWPVLWLSRKDATDEFEEPGFEPGTYGLEGRCAIRLRYSSINKNATVLDKPWIIQNRRQQSMHLQWYPHHWGC